MSQVGVESEQIIRIRGRAPSRRVAPQRLGPRRGGGGAGLVKPFRRRWGWRDRDWG